MYSGRRFSKPGTGFANDAFTRKLSNKTIADTLDVFYVARTVLAVA
jgi:hypothetical protein